MLTTPRCWQQLSDVLIVPGTKVKDV
jgi:hypothetical protein